MPAKVDTINSTEAYLLDNGEYIKKPNIIGNLNDLKPTFNPIRIKPG